jgi:hypothetical protein
MLIATSPHATFDLLHVHLLHTQCHHLLLCKHRENHHHLMSKLKNFCCFPLCTTQILHRCLQWIMEFDGRTISRMSYANELKILESKGTQQDRSWFWRLEDLNISSSFCAFVPSVYYVHCFVFGWFWMQMRHKLENQCVLTPIWYIESQVPMNL